MRVQQQTTTIRVCCLRDIKSQLTTLKTPAQNLTDHFLIMILIRLKASLSLSSIDNSRNKQISLTLWMISKEGKVKGKMQMYSRSNKKIPSKRPRCQWFHPASQSTSIATIKLASTSTTIIHLYPRLTPPSRCSLSFPKKTSQCKTGRT